MEAIYLNPGPLSSFNSLVYYLGPQLEKIRNLYIHGSSPEIILDLKNLNTQNINIPALAALLSNCHKLSQFFGRPIVTEFSLNPYIQNFLNHVHFFRIAKKLKILVWDEKTVGGFWPSDMNPHTKLLYFGDVHESVEKNTPDEIVRIKAVLKQKIGPNFSLRCSEIFKSFDPKLEYSVENTALELITNCLIHAKDYAFVGIQRTSKRITVSVCDSGMGFKKSLVNSYPDYLIFRGASNIQAIVIGSLIQQYEHGLRLAINHVLNYNDSQYNTRNDGWVIISSYDSEIRWQKPNWDRAIEYFQETGLGLKLPDISLLLGDELNKKVPYEQLEQGYWRNYKNILMGTRITFEIPIV
ncbi:hypothetical protein D4R20_02685 [bacterium]|nr:MAG: hypothetical protein D4R20_02685 [bacterium]